MEDMNQRTVPNGECVFHQKYCLYNNYREIVYDHGAICRVYLDLPIGSLGADVQVYYSSGEMYWWKTKWISSYTFQFGVAVSFDGKYVFVQTWENGLLCLDARTGKTIWRTKSKRGVTHIFVNADIVLCHQRGHALQLLDIHTGEVLSEKRPATAWGFTALDHRHIICQVTARRWEIIDAQTLETVEVFSHKVFTGGHEDYCINKIGRTQDGKIKVCGFKNVWDRSVKPAVMLPNLEFEHYVESKVLAQSKMTYDEV